MKLEIVTPDQRIERTGLQTILFQSPDGQTGILAGHVPMICQLEIGPLVVTDGSRRERFVTSGGMARIHGDHVVLLLLELAGEDEIDAEEVKLRIERLEGTLAKSRFRPEWEEHDETQRELLYARAQRDLLADRSR